jgi:hypothetical protein
MLNLTNAASPTRSKTLSPSPCLSISNASSCETPLSADAASCRFCIEPPASWPKARHLSSPKSYLAQRVRRNACDEARAMKRVRSNAGSARALRQSRPALCLAPGVFRAESNNSTRHNLLPGCLACCAQTSCLSLLRPRASLFCCSCSDRVVQLDPPRRRARLQDCGTTI